VTFYKNEELVPSSKDKKVSHPVLDSNILMSGTHGRKNIRIIVNSEMQIKIAYKIDSQV
jgi:hypothetical protein